MPKFFAAALVTLALAACSGAELSVTGRVPIGESGKLRDLHKAEPSPEEDPKAPGQIPHRIFLYVSLSAGEHFDLRHRLDEREQPRHPCRR
jgi:hypothetical protein